MAGARSLQPQTRWRSEWNSNLRHSLRGESEANPNRNRDKRDQLPATRPFFFQVPAGSVPAFGEGLGALHTESDLERFVARHGLRRTDGRFWPLLDRLHAGHACRSPTEAGLYDLGRYKNL